MGKTRQAKGTLVLLRDVFDIFFLYWLPQSSFKNFLRRILMRRIGLSFYGLANKGDTVVQGGCFMIETVAKWSDVVGKDGKVIIIEISKENIDILRYDIKRRSLNNVILVHSGVWDKKEEKELSISESSHLSMLNNTKISSKILTKEDFVGTDVVTVDSIDHILEELNITKVNVVNLTISGAEREALRGMNHTIKVNHPRIAIRCSFYDNHSGHHTSFDTTRFLENVGYFTALGIREKGDVARNIFGCWKINN